MPTLRNTLLLHVLSYINLSVMYIVNYKVNIELIMTYSMQSLN